MQFRGWMIALIGTAMLFTIQNGIWGQATNIVDTNAQKEFVDKVEKKGYEKITGPSTNITTGTTGTMDTSTVGGVTAVKTPVSISNASKAITSAVFEWYLTTSFNRFGNGDLRKTDNTSRATVENTDDEIFIANTEIGASVDVQILDYIKLNCEIYRPSFWGNDSLQTGTTTLNLFIRLLSFELDINQTLLKSPLFDLNLKIGRQEYGVFNPDFEQKTYIYGDVIDGITAKFFLKGIGVGVDAMVDFFSLNSPTTTIYSLLSPRQNYTVAYFNGDVNIFKLGVMPYYRMELQNSLIQMVEARPFFLFARLGAVGNGSYNQGGAEQSALGFQGNFADNDWVMNFGLTAYAEASFFNVSGEFAYAIGIDRKSSSKPDVNISGLLAHLQAEVDFGWLSMVSPLKLDWLKLGFNLMFASGAATDTNGNYINYGYVSFKGNKIGGMLFTTYYGSYPSAIVNYDGIIYEPIEASRRAGTAAISFDLGVEDFDFTTMAKGTQGLTAGLEGWFYWDTSSTSYNSNVTQSTYVYDQRRFGKFMGVEMDGKIEYSFSDGVFDVGIEAGFFVPYQYFLYPVSITTAPYGLDTFWGVSVYTGLNF